MQDKDAQTTQQPLSRSIETAAAVLAERCFTDKAFGEKFLANPAAALAEKKIKTGKRQVHVHENDARNWHIPLPNLKTRKDLSALDKYSADELKAMSDADLRRLSGGEILGVVGITLAVTGGTIAAGITTAAVAGGAIGASRAADKKK